jgi:hypothetical protein
MVVAMQKLTSLSPSRTTLAGLQARQGASLALPSAGEPLNPTTRKGLSPAGIGEGKSHPGSRPGGGPNRPRVPVVDARGVPLMPCTPVRARLLLKRGKAVARWNKLGIFYIKLKYPVEPKNQMSAVGVDPGSKFEAESVVGTKDTVLNIMHEAVDWVKEALEQRRQMRRARRYRKTRYRKCKRNRKRKEGWIPPSTKARWDAKLRIIAQLKKIIPISHAVVENVSAESKKGSKRWNSNFSPVEVGKQYFYSQLRTMGFEVVVKNSYETKKFRDGLGLRKIKNKSKPVFESQCVDSWCLAAMVTGAKYPSTKSLYYMVPLRWHRRQLHRLQFEKGGVRKRYGGTMSLGLKRGTLVRHVRYGLCYIGGFQDDGFSLHNLRSGKRLTQHAKREEFKVLTRIAFRTRFISSLSDLMK